MLQSSHDRACLERGHRHAPPRQVTMLHMKSAPKKSASVAMHAAADASQTPNKAMPPLDQPWQLLGGISPQAFMKKYWQKKPLLIKQAVPGVVSPISRAELFELAAQDDVESRMVVQGGPAKGKKPSPEWSLLHGPFERNRLPKLSQPKWTLLVQGLDLHVPAAHDILQQFRFVPDARLDDLMISYATDGGGVGPAGLQQGCRLEPVGGAGENTAGHRRASAERGEQGAATAACARGICEGRLRSAGQYAGRGARVSGGGDQAVQRYCEEDRVEAGVVTFGRSVPEYAALLPGYGLRRMGRGPQGRNPSLLMHAG